MRTILGCIIALVAGHSALGAETVYETPELFLAAAFPQAVPAARVLWPQENLRAQLTDILKQRPGMRIRYWQDGARTAWVLDDIGKDKPITAGFVVNNGAIEQVQVLVFRESRGWEVKYPFFTRQFQKARLSDGGKLTRDVDGITGATLSVRAMTRMARAALVLDGHVQQLNANHANYSNWAKAREADSG
jgi:hypothetical protein